MLSEVESNWSGVLEFAEWWTESGRPLAPPSNAEVFVTDDATAFCLFRRGAFQVELYLLHPKSRLDQHEHPGVEVIQRFLSASPSEFSPVLRQGMSHGNFSASFVGINSGLAILTFEHWLKDRPSTAAAAWKGPTVGPMQEGLIRRFYPDAFIERGYADITKPANYRQLVLEGKA